MKKCILIIVVMVVSFFACTNTKPQIELNFDVESDSDQNLIAIPQRTKPQKIKYLLGENVIEEKATLIGKFKLFVEDSQGKMDLEKITIRIRAQFASHEQMIPPGEELSFLKRVKNIRLLVNDIWVKLERIIDNCCDENTKDFVFYPNQKIWNNFMILKLYISPIEDGKMSQGKITIADIEISVEDRMADLTLTPKLGCAAKELNVFHSAKDTGVYIYINQ